MIDRVTRSASSKQSLKERLKAAIMLFLLCLGLLSLFELTAESRRRLYPVVGSDRLDTASLEDHNDALKRWVEKGIRNSILVNIDAHDDIRRISPEDMEKLRAAYHDSSQTLKLNSGRFRDYPVTNSNFIYAAAKLGIVSEVYWIVPSTYDLFSDSGSRLAALLKAYGFPDEDIGTFGLKDGCFIGSADGIPIHICQPERLPDLSEPILLTIDVDFFPEPVFAFGYRITEVVRQTLLSMYRKKYVAQDVTVAYSVSGGFLDASRRWVGDLVVDALKKPAMLLQDELPDHYSILQRADILLLVNRYDDLLNYILPLINERPVPSLLMYAAEAFQSVGETGKAFHYAEQACLIERRYCYGLSGIGNKLLDGYGLRSAERFFSRAYQLRPKMDHGQFRLAMALMKSGRYDEAIEYFQVFREIYGPFPVDFYLAEAYELKRDERSALRYYESGRAELSGSPFALSRFGDRGAIENAARFYEGRGYNRFASQLRSILNTQRTG